MNSLLLTRVLALAFIVTGCGRKLVTDIQVDTSVVDQRDVSVNVQAQLDLGNMQLPIGVSVPIKDYGQLTFQPRVLGGGQGLELSLNLSKIVPLQVGGGTLPNGRPIPMIASSPVAEIGVGNGEMIRIYATFFRDDSGRRIAGLGLAIPFAAFNGLGQAIGNANVFPVFKIGEVNLAAGFFTGSSDGENGIAIVVDLTNLLPDEQKDLLSQSAVLAESFVSYSQKGMSSDEHVLSSGQKSKFDREIYKLHRSGQKLTLY